MYPHNPNGQAQWTSQPSSQPPNGYPHLPPASQLSVSLPPPQTAEPPPSMASTYNPQQPYRLPVPPEMYRPAPPPQDPYRPPPPQPHMTYQQHQPAPRQRTAIACRYCRRRKIRCSGFENSEDGRCTNCVRFSQECIFTPVAAQSQAFVPAHAWRGPGHPPALYGAYGQPLPPPPQAHPPEAYAPRPQGYPLPSPTASSSASYHSTAPQPGVAQSAAQPYYARRSSPQSTYSYDPSRASSSPHTQATGTPGSTPYPPSNYSSDGALRPPPNTIPPLRQDGRTPPPVSQPPVTTSGGRAGLRIADMVSSDTGRSATDSHMLSALDRRPM